MLVRLPATQGNEEKAPWVCPEFIEALVPDKDDLSQAFVYMKSGISFKVRVDADKMAFEEIVDVIKAARRQQSDFNSAFDDYWNRERNGSGKM